MSKKDKHDRASNENENGTASTSTDTKEKKAAISLEDYHAELHILQIELVKLQRHFIGCGDKILVLIEGRDAAGKDGSIKRIVEYLSRPTGTYAAGTFNATSPTFRWPKSSCYSTAAGTTALVLNM
jgi:polyphosphate kinase 2 (PPK2 family)